MLVPNRIKEYGRTDYDSRRTWDSGLDAGSTPARSTKAKHVELSVRYYRIRKYMLFSISMEVKITAVYVAKVIYSVVIFML